MNKNAITNNFDVVVMAASAGGLHALESVLSCLPADFPCPVLLVQNLDRHHRSLMASILSRRSPMPVKQGEEAEELLNSTVYIAPPDHHMLVTPDFKVSLTQSKLVNFVRPSADLLFESVAAVYKDGAIAVILSGTGSDGSMGVKAIKQMGGKVIVQDFKEAEFSGMPESAFRTGSVDFVLPLDEIAPAIVQLVSGAKVN